MNTKRKFEPFHPGSPDESFAAQGTLVFPHKANPALIRYRGRSLQLSDGKILMAGVAAPLPRFELRRYTAEGPLDLEFGNDGLVTLNVPIAEPTDVAVQTDGKIVIYAASGSSVKRNIVLMRVAPEGDLDPDFGTGGFTEVAMPASSVDMGTKRLAVLPDGKFIGVIISRAWLNETSWLVRFSSDGLLDTSFGNEGILPVAPAGLFGPLIVGADHIFGAGMVNKRAVVAKYSFEGVLDQTFGIDGYFTYAPADVQHFALIEGVALQPDGKLVAVGKVGPVAGNDQGCDAFILRLAGDGHLDVAFNGGQPYVIGLRVDARKATYVLLQKDGKILVAGESPSFNTATVFRLHQDGAIDDTFGEPELDGSPGFRGFMYLPMPWSRFGCSVSTLEFTANGKLLAFGVVNLEHQVFDSLYVARMFL